MKVTNYCIWFGHSLWSANQLPAQEVNLSRGTEQIKHVLFDLFSICLSSLNF